ncbi:unnamed protein product [Sphagnum troendelagicum]|uniref:Uncharacterized protein n=1 Tax=Sphagnum troendelagicum TaxID=128251 RepID=A0ABP0UEG4_9BRYO
MHLRKSSTMLRCLRLMKYHLHALEDVYAKITCNVAYLQTLKEKENAIAENQRTANALEEVKHNAEVSKTDEISFACPGRCVCKDHL